MNSRNHTLDQKINVPLSFAPGQRDPLRVAVMVEDLRLPLDEGAKKTSFSLICSFIKQGMKVSVFNWYRNPLLENVYPLPGNKFLLGYSFARNLRAQKPDIILYIPASSGTLGAFVRAAVIKVQSFGTPLALLNLQYRQLPAFARYLGLYRHADLVFTQSQSSADVFRSFGCKTVLLPGGVDHTIFRPVGKSEKHLLRLQYGFHDEDQIVLHIGHCKRDRNVSILARLARSGFKVILVASTSTLMDHDLLTELGQSGVIVMTGFIENIQHLYQIADCYLFPVLHATSAIDAPLSVLEAMACNVPVVTTRFGALPSLFPDGDGLYYVDTGAEIVDLVNQAIKHQQGCNTFEKVSLYSWENVAATILESLQEACEL